MSKVGKKMVCRLSETALPLSTDYVWYCSSALFWGWAAIMDCLWKKAAMFFCNLLNLLGVSWRAFYIYTVFNYCCFICDMTGVALLLGTAILGGKPSSLQGTSDLRLHKAPSTSLNLLPAASSRVAGRSMLPPACRWLLVHFCSYTFYGPGLRDQHFNNKSVLILFVLDLHNFAGVWWHVTCAIT